MNHGWRCCWIIEPRRGHIVTCTALLTFTCPAVPCNCTKCAPLAMHVKSPASARVGRARCARAHPMLVPRWTVSITALVRGLAPERTHRHRRVPESDQPVVSMSFFLEYQ